MNAVWIDEYDFRCDKCYKAPGCPKCDAPLYKFGNDFKCVACGKALKVTDPDMKKWFTEREEVKTEFKDCPKIPLKDGRSMGCGGKKCVETHYRRNPVTLEWEVTDGRCMKCELSFIV